MFQAMPLPYPKYIQFTVIWISIGTPKIINFPFVPNGKLIIFRCPKIKVPKYRLITNCY